MVRTLIVAVLFLAGELAHAFPDKPLRFVVGFTPGGPSDILARAVGQKLGERWSQQVVVENRPGAGGNLAAEVVAKSAPDGYTWLLGNNSILATNHALYKKLSYDPLKDFAPVAPVNLSPLLLVAHPSVGARNVRELVAIAKRHPGTTMGNSGVGTVTHMTAERFRLRAGIQVTAVSYKGGALPVLALLGGEIALVMATVPASIQYVRQGKLVGLGVSAARRSPYLPDMPTISETVPGVEGAVFSGVLAPAGTPASVVQLLNAEFAKASENPKAKEIYATNVAEAVVLSPAALAEVLERDVRAWAEVVKATGVKIE